MNLSWGWSRNALNQVNYDTDQQDTWIAELRGLLNDCVNIGLLVSLLSRPISLRQSNGRCD